ncbi:Blood vessel epicardial substance, partial [Bienertia sinuspersici]
MAPPVTENAYCVLDDPDEEVLEDVRDVIKRNKISLIALIETRVKMAKSSKLAAKLGRPWQWINNYNCSNKGRLWLVWKVHDVDVDVLVIHEQFIHVKVHSIHNGYVFLATFVYGLHSVEDRRPLWKGLKHLASGICLPWLILGDFNSLLHIDDRWNGSTLKSVGPYYSWSNKAIRDVRTLSRIDWAFGNSNWFLQFGEVTVVYGDPLISDHSPLLLDMGGSVCLRAAPFRLFNYMAQHKDFEDMVIQAWRDSIAGNPLKVTGEGEDYIMNSKKWLSIEESVPRQKARIQWLKLGDSNEQFFYSTVKAGHNFNYVRVLYLIRDIRGEFVKFYSILLGSSSTELESIDLPKVRDSPQ